MYIFFILVDSWDQNKVASDHILSLGIKGYYKVMITFSLIMNSISNLFLACADSANPLTLYLQQIYFILISQRLIHWTWNRGRYLRCFLILLKSVQPWFIWQTRWRIILRNEILLQMKDIARLQSNPF